MDTTDITFKKGSDDRTYFEIEGPLFESGNERIGKFWIATDTIGEYCHRGQATAVAQFYKLVIPGLILTRHIFGGLERPLFCDEQMNGDTNKYVFSIKPAWDFIWQGGPTGRPVQVNAPDNAVFVVIISKNHRHKENFPEVDGWIERWNWVEESTGLLEAPAGWVDRYNEKIWTRR